MKYMCLIYTAPGAEPSDPAELGAVMQRYFEFTDAVEADGRLVAGEPLQGIETATTVRVRDGATLTTDGPFAETKEHLGGFYLLECDDLDQALAYAARIPAADYGSIEIRPLMEVPPRS